MARLSRCRPPVVPLCCAAMGRVGLIGFLFLLGVVTYVLAGSFSVSAHSCEVCMEYKGRAQCRTVEAETIELARDGAIQNACAHLSGGVTDSMACHREQPRSAKCQ
jgi:hypothetical protein